MNIEDFTEIEIIIVGCVLIFLFLIVLLSFASALDKAQIPFKNFISQNNIKFLERG